MTQDPATETLLREGAAASTRPSPSAPPPLVLIVVDSLSETQRLQHILEQRGYRVQAAINGRAALEFVRHERPALIVSDVAMPEMTGFELCRLIKQDAGLGDVPVVLITLLSDPHDVIRGLECGADNLILKPYETDQLLRRIQPMLANDVLRRELSSTRDELRHAKLEIQQLTQALEEHARARTGELERNDEHSRQALEPHHPAPSCDAPLPSKRILVIDDDPMLSQSLRNTLQAEGHDVTIASGGRAGIDTFQAALRTAKAFHAVITDLGMPHVDGRQVSRTIRALSADVPIIMLTGWGRNQLADTTPPPEVNRLLNKPPRLSELRAALAELTPTTYAAAPDQPREAIRRDPR